MKTKIPIDSIPAFAPIQADELESLSNLPRQRLIAPGTVLQEQGQAPASVFLLWSGLVKLIHTNPGGKQCVLGLRASGWFAGAAYALTKTHNTCTVAAISQCVVSVFDLAEFDVQMNSNLDLMKYLLKAQAREIITIRELTIQFSSRTAEERLNQFLREAESGVETWNTLNAIPVLKQSEVAQLLAITPEHLSRISQRKRQNNQPAKPQKPTKRSNPSSSDVPD